MIDVFRFGGFVGWWANLFIALWVGHRAEDGTLLAIEALLFFIVALLHGVLYLLAGLAGSQPTDTGGRS